MKHPFLPPSRRVIACAIPLLAFFLPALAANAQTATNIQVTSTVQSSGVKRFGINLADQDFYDSGQMLKNLVFQNPGFEAEKYRSIMYCNAVTANTCTDDNNYSPQPTGFWKGATYQILTGNSAGKTGTITSSTKNPSSCSGCGQIIQFDQSINAAVGDYFVMTQNFPGSGDTGWWDSTGGGGTILSETSDLSPETPGKQALVLNASSSGQSASVAQYFDSTAGLSFIQLNGAFAVTFRAKGVGGSNKLSVNVQRTNTAGNLVYLNQTLTLTNAWQDYTLTFNASETGSAIGTAQLVFTASGSSVELDDVSLAQTNSSPSNPTAFRDDVVNTLTELNPGTIRMMAGGAALGADLIDQIQVPFARYREGWSTGSTTTDAIPYGIHEFLQLCQTVGADPWITIPTATTTTEMQAFIQYLTGTGSDQYSSLRISRGQTAPWTSVFNKIHLELGNETWNGQFRGESMNYDGYPYVANTVFAAARATSGYVASKFDLVLDGLAASPGYNQVLLARSTKHDSIDIAPYLLYSGNDEAQSTMFGALFAEPEIFDSAGGEVYQNVVTANAAPTPTAVSVYETNLSPIVGNITEAELNSLTPSMGAGIGHTVHMLEMMRAGVQYQNAFALPQWAFKRSDGLTVKLWGTVIDMGTTNRRRPQFHTQSMANSVIGGNMLATTQTGANPTWNQPLSSDNVQLNGAHYLQSFAFQNGSNVSVIVFNLSQTTSLPVTFSGTNAPSGSVQMTQITSANITDNNETSQVIAPTTKTLNGFNPSTGLTLPPFSMTVLTTASTTTQPPVFSPAGGTYTSAQTVTMSDATSGAAIYYTTDGSTPTTSSTKYSSAITVKSNETLNAIAVASGLGTSPVTSASYVINAAGSSTAATPVFSPAGGTYTSTQSVTISDATSGAAIYYTTNGATPTTSSTKYTGAISVSATETLKAIAVASNYTNSAVASAAYTISGKQTATPVISKASGTYNSTFTVTITDATSGAAIGYTINGGAATKYTGPITVNKSMTLVAGAAATGYSTSAAATAKYTLQAAAPAFSASPGTYTAAQSVVLSSATSGAAIYYTTNGTTPTASSTKYTGAIKISATTTVKAIAVATNFANSAVSSATYTIGNKQTATPVISRASGTYNSAFTVTITDATSGAVIGYTINGGAATKYTGPITVNKSMTLVAGATANGYSTSAAATAKYTLQAAAPVFSVAPGTYTAAQSLVLSSATSGAAIYYTTNGATPTTSSTRYAGAIKLSATATVKAIAVATNFANSAVSSAVYTISNKQTATPKISVASGTYNSAFTVTITDATSGAVIAYQINGGAPTKYTGPITVNKSMTLVAGAVATGHSTSAAATATYTLKAATPTLSVASGSYTTAPAVSMKTATAGATIFYTTNGSTPTASSTKYTGPITVSTSQTVRVIAAKTSFTPSDVVAATYKIVAAAPVFSVKGGKYTAVQTVTLSSATSGATIYYTTNGATPTTSSTKYSGAIKVSSSATVKAIAISAKAAESAVSTAVYTIELKAAAPTFSLKSGTYTAPQTLIMQSETSDASIYYTVDGTTPTTSSTKYTGPIHVSVTKTVSAVAKSSKTSLSAVTRAAYTVK
jgi:alpha-L-arabinofuranosidase